ncbi:hypothetical protein GQ53DRAFT_850111 [Thozetella sp. PMI_491]|nr:hypothetical protein GQ53DRAFT_850111 [Thozetella sp. PMI_491]
MMAAEATDLAADLLAALNSSAVEETPELLLSAQPIQPEQAIEPEAPFLTSTATNAPTEPLATTTDSASSVPTIDPPQALVPAQSPKRQRTPDFAGGNDAKRSKIDHEPSMDMAMLLQNALGSLDDGLGPLAATEDTVMEDVVAADSATATPAPAKPEPTLMRASDNPVFMMRSMSLPVLGNLAVQTLLRLGQQSRESTQALLSDKQTEFYKTYEALKRIFGPARNIFSDVALLLSCDELDITDSEDRETIRMSNLATVSLSLFDSQDVLLKEIHDQFLAIFVQELGEYKESATDFYVGLKTQAFIGDVQHLPEGESAFGLLDHYFPADFEESLKQRNGEIFLSLSEDLLVAAVKERRDLLAHELPRTESATSQNQGPELSDLQILRLSLAEQYPTDSLLDDFSAYLQAHLGSIIEYAEKYGVNIPVAEDTTAKDSPAPPPAPAATAITVPVPALAPDPDPVGELVDHDDLAALLQSATAKMEEEIVEPPKEEESSAADGLGLSSIIQESLNSEMDLASLIRENLGDTTETKPQPGYTMPSYATINGEVNGQPQFQSLAQLNQLHASPYHSYTQTVPQPQPNVSENGDLLPPNQSSPTAVLYERARQAAVAKSSSSTRREGLHSTRRPWTPEEEKALMAGLDMVKGPHWSQILSLFGVNGTISDILKDRTQVQLKDKARNLKLFFLKTSSEMPYYLQSVTGELKTRAPSQAARKEAEEKARVNSEEEQARLQGIMTLASGLQNNHPNARSPIPASTPVLGSPMTPRIGLAGTSGTPTPQGPANIAPAPMAGSAKSPDIKSEPVDHVGMAHGLPQNGLPIAQQLAQIHSRVKQEVHGLPQIQPRVPTPHAPLAPAPQAQALSQPQPQSHGLPQTQNIPRQSPQTTATYPPFRPQQLAHLQPHPSASAQTPAQGQQALQQQQQSSASRPGQVQLSAAQGSAQTPQPAQTQTQDGGHHPSVQAAQLQTSQVAAAAVPQPAPHTPTPTPNMSNSGCDPTNFSPPTSSNHAADDSAEASLLETLRAAMASAPESHTPLVSSEAPTA